MAASLGHITYRVKHPAWRTFRAREILPRTLERTRAAVGINGFTLGPLMGEDGPAWGDGFVSGRSGRPRR